MFGLDDEDFELNIKPVGGAVVLSKEEAKQRKKEGKRLDGSHSQQQQAPTTSQVVSDTASFTEQNEAPTLEERKYINLSEYTAIVYPVKKIRSNSELEQFFEEYNPKKARIAFRKDKSLEKAAIEFSEEKDMHQAIQDLNNTIQKKIADCKIVVRKMNEKDLSLFPKSKSNPKKSNKSKRKNNYTRYSYSIEEFNEMNQKSQCLNTSRTATASSYSSSSPYSSSSSSSGKTGYLSSIKNDFDEERSKALEWLISRSKEKKKQIEKERRELEIEKEKQSERFSHRMSQRFKEEITNLGTESQGNSSTPPSSIDFPNHSNIDLNNDDDDDDDDDIDDVDDQ